MAPVSQPSVRSGDTPTIVCLVPDSRLSGPESLLNQSEPFGAKVLGFVIRSGVLVGVAQAQDFILAGKAYGQAKAFDTNVSRFVIEADDPAGESLPQAMQADVVGSDFDTSASRAAPIFSTGSEVGRFLK